MMSVIVEINFVYMHCAACVTDSHRLIPSHWAVGTLIYYGAAFSIELCVHVNECVIEKLVTPLILF